MTPRSLASFARRIAFVETDADLGECWLWTGGVIRGGYARLGARLAHRIAYQHFVGEIPVSCELDHLCRMRSCVNPRHVQPVSHLENIRRGACTRDSGYYDMRSKLTAESRAKISRAVSATLKGRRKNPEQRQKIATGMLACWARRRIEAA